MSKSRGEAKGCTDSAEALADLLCLPKPGRKSKPKSVRPRLRASVVRGAAYLIDNTGVVALIEQWYDEDHPGWREKGGRPRTIEIRALLIMLIALLASGGDAPLITNVAEVYRCRLNTKSRSLLNLPIVNVLTEGAAYMRVYRVLNVVRHLVDPYPAPRRGRISRSELEALEVAWEQAEMTISGVTQRVVDVKRQRLDIMTNALLQGTFDLMPLEAQQAWEGNICIDATLMRVWGKSGSPKKEGGKPTDRMSPEHHAGWYTRTETDKRKSKYAWGYEAHLAVMTTNQPSVPSLFPNLILGMSFARPGVDPGGNGLAAAASIIKRGHPAGICAADRAYFPDAAAENWQLPMRALGYKLIGDYRKDQLGIQAQQHGALLIEGSWYCPGIPAPLISATKDYRDGIVTDETYAARITQRTQYLFRPKHRPDPTGNTAYMCAGRGSGATACCPLVPSTGPVDVTLLTTRTQILNPPKEPDRACTNSSSITLSVAPNPTSVPLDTNIAKYLQDVQYATTEWQSLWSTLRNTVEGINAYAKSANHEQLEEAGRRRLRGFASQALITAFLAASANLRKISLFMKTTVSEPSPSPLTSTKAKHHLGTPNIAAYAPDANGPPLAKPA